MERMGTFETTSSLMSHAPPNLLHPQTATFKCRLYVYVCPVNLSGSFELVCLVMRSGIRFTASRDSLLPIFGRKRMLFSFYELVYLYSMAHFLLMGIWE